MGRAYWYTKQDYVAECEDCPWTGGGFGGQGHAALHHDRTGHKVHVDIMKSLIYGEDEPGKRRWWKEQSND